MRMLIRKIEVGDSLDLFRLRNLSQDVPFYKNANEVSFEDHEIWINQRVSCLDLYTWVAEDCNRLIGVCYLNRIVDGLSEISIRVFPAWRGTECAQRLLHRAIKGAGSAKVHTVIAMVHQENFRSLSFFSKNGFREKEVQEEFVVLALTLD